MTDKGGKRSGTEREERLAAALRANLARRKAQVRARGREAEQDGSERSEPSELNTGRSK